MKTIFENQARPFRRAFTLIELLVVIAIIAVLAALTLSVMSGVSKKQKISVARAEMQTIETALENYKDRYGAYPPGGTNPVVNQLYYELSGTTTNVPPGDPSGYETLDSASFISMSQLETFGVGGFVNCTKGDGEDAVLAKDFLSGLKPNQVAKNSDGVAFLVTSVGGPDPFGPSPNYQPLPHASGNPFCYAYPGTNNPSSYDLWVDLRFNGKTNRVSNWSSQTIIIQ